MKLGLKDKIAFVSGGSAGMGRSIARELAEEGARVVIVARREEPLRETAAEIEAAGGKIAWVVGDMSVAEDVDRAVAFARETFGDPDIAIWNTRSILRYSFDSATPDDFRQSCEQVILSQVYVAKALIPAMKAKGWGRFVNLGSVCSKEPHRFYNIVLSNTFRTAALGLTKTLANELGPDGITVNTIAPGSIDTGLNVAVSKGGTDIGIAKLEEEPRIPLGRSGTPEEISALAVFLCSERASYITGQVIAVDGGWTRGLW